MFWKFNTTRFSLKTIQREAWDACPANFSQLHIQINAPYYTEHYQSWTSLPVQIHRQPPLGVEPGFVQSGSKYQEPLWYLIAFADIKGQKMISHGTIKVCYDICGVNCWKTENLIKMIAIPFDFSISVLVFFLLPLTTTERESKNVLIVGAMMGRGRGVQESA